VPVLAKYRKYLKISKLNTNRKIIIVEIIHTLLNYYSEIIKKGLKRKMLTSISIFFY